MSYIERISKHYPEAFSKSESLAILERYKFEFTEREYQVVYNSLCSHALENIYLNEKDILVSISHFRQEISLAEVINIAKSS